MYQITNLSETQLQIIQEALDLYARVKVNQLGTVAYSCMEELGNNFGSLRDILHAIEKKEFISNNVHQSKKACIAFDIHDVIRHKLSWDRHPEGGWTVNFDDPLHWGSEPLCKVEKVNDTNE